MIFRAFSNTLGDVARRGLEALGYGGALFFESFYWLLLGRRYGQVVSAAPIAAQLMEVGVRAIPIVAVLSFAIGVSLAIQLIFSLSEFGAESKSVFAIAKAVTREFGPLITGILVAGRTASALAARIGSMVVSQEVDALRVIGVNPVRYLAAPPLLALLIMMPILTILSDLSAIIGGALYSLTLLQLDLWAYLMISLDSLNQSDIMQGLQKSLVFAVIIAVVGVSSGFGVVGGAEGVGRATTRAVVSAISWIVIADMVFTYFQNR
jgi:phospholipid/cholesterol/gamma-HCH transport system permease protein